MVSGMNWHNKGVLMSDSLVLIEKREQGVVVLSLNRPDKRNAMSVALMEELCNHLDQLSDDEETRVVVIRGEGPLFCAGLDLKEAADTSIATRSAELVATTFEKICFAPFVTVAAVHGGVYAGGAGIMASCDFVVAGEEVIIGFPEVRRGLVPALVTALLSQKLSAAVMKELMILGEPLGIKRAQNVGLVQFVTSAENLSRKVEDVVEKILLGAPGAIGTTKKLLSEFSNTDLKQRFRIALDSHQEARVSEEALEGMAAFREKRIPKWQQ